MKDSALVIVDMLYDFIDGSLACLNADNAVENTAAFIDKMTYGQNGDESEILDTYPILFICDHHPANHCSFKENGGIWPVHCVAGTRGGDVHETLKPYMREELTFYKGTDSSKEQYSGFEGKNTAGQSLGEILELLDINNVYVAGIATEFCVRSTCEDLKKAGFNVTVLSDGLAYVDKQGHTDTLTRMKGEGFTIL